MEITARVEALSGLSGVVERYEAEKNLVDEIVSNEELLKSWSATFESNFSDPLFHRIDGIVHSRLGSTELAWIRFYEYISNVLIDDALLAHLVLNAELGGRQKIYSWLIQFIDFEMFNQHEWLIRKVRLDSEKLFSLSHEKDAKALLYCPEFESIFARPNDLNPLIALIGWEYLETVENVCVLGAHTFEEKPVFEKLFPNVTRFQLVEANPKVAERCAKGHEYDPRVNVASLALSNRDGFIEFNVSSNDGLSSSIMEMGDHTRYDTQTKMVETVRVPTKNWVNFLAEKKLAVPEFLLVDVQGAEYEILASIPTEHLKEIGILFCEASTTEIYKGAKTFEEVVSLLDETHYLVDYYGYDSFNSTHGNALFINRSLINESDKNVATILKELSVDKGPLQTSQPQNVEERILKEIWGPFLSNLERFREGASLNNDLLIWGAGSYGQKVADCLRGLRIPFSGFVDRDPSKTGTILKGKQIISPDMFESKLGSAASKPYVLVGTSYKAELFKYFDKIGFEPQKDYYSALL
jgi:FkbM family methyltransferase